MPPSLKSLWDPLHNEVVWLHGHWIIFRQLFAKSPERLKFLNDCNGTLFFIIQGLLLSHLQITLSKLGDPARIGNSANLTFETLLLQIESLNEAVLSQRLRAILADYQRSCDRVRERRNKQLVHYDFGTLLRAKSAPIPRVSLQEIAHALSKASAFMNEIDKHFTSSTTAYDQFPLREGDHLVHCLKEAVRYEELQESESIPFDDLQKSSLFLV